MSNGSFWNNKSTPVLFTVSPSRKDTLATTITSGLLLQQIAPYARAGRIQSTCLCSSSPLASPSCGGIVVPLLVTGSVGFGGAYTAQAFYARRLRVIGDGVSVLG